MKLTFVNDDIISLKSSVFNCESFDGSDTESDGTIQLSNINLNKAKENDTVFERPGNFGQTFDESLIDGNWTSSTTREPNLKPSKHKISSNIHKEDVAKTNEKLLELLNLQKVIEKWRQEIYEAHDKAMYTVEREYLVIKKEFDQQKEFLAKAFENTLESFRDKELVINQHIIDAKERLLGIREISTPIEPLPVLVIEYHDDLKTQYQMLTQVSKYVPITKYKRKDMSKNPFDSFHIDPSSPNLTLTFKFDELIVNGCGLDYLPYLEFEYKRFCFRCGSEIQFCYDRYEFFGPRLVVEGIMKSRCHHTLVWDRKESTKRMLYFKVYGRWFEIEIPYQLSSLGPG